MSNVPKHNPHISKAEPERSSRPKTSTPNNPDPIVPRKSKVVRPSWSKGPDESRIVLGSKTANPSMPWSEPEIDEIDPLSPGCGLYDGD